MTEKQERSASLLKQWRRMRRDLLWLKYGDEWTKHDSRIGHFWDEASEDEKAELATLMAIADAPR